MAKTQREVAKAQKSQKPQKSKGFFPEGYEPPKGTSNYMKFQPGENKFRILDNPIFGWVEWIDEKPSRTPEKPEEAYDADEPPKHFWAIKVFDYSDNTVKILELTQASVQKAIAALNDDEDWGDPKNYDIKVTKTGEKLTTKYAVTPSPKKPLSKDVAKAHAEKSCDLEALFDGADPWA